MVRQNKQMADVKIAMLTLEPIYTFPIPYHRPGARTWLALGLSSGSWDQQLDTSCASGRFQWYGSGGLKPCATCRTQMGALRC